MVVNVQLQQVFLAILPVPVAIAALQMDTILAVVGRIQFIELIKAFQIHRFHFIILQATWLQLKLGSLIQET